MRTRHLSSRELAAAASAAILAVMGVHPWLDLAIRAADVSRSIQSLDALAAHAPSLE
jgi:hypothetical protein